MEQLHVLTTDSSITVWWQKPENAPARYEVALNGKLRAVTEKTHCTIEGLAADTDYAVHVCGLSAQAHTRPAFQRIDVTARPYWAKGDGETLNTHLLQRAIDECPEDGFLYFPRGVYMTGALRLHSHMAIYLDEGAVLQGTDEIADYEPRIPSRFEGLEMMCYSSVLNLGHMDHNAGANCEDVLIYGHGTIASGGRTLARRIVEDERIRMAEYLRELGDQVKEYENTDTLPGRVRPRLINMSNCRNIRISGLTLANGASWNVHMIYSSGITTDHCTFRSENVWNGDGWDPDSSEDCTLFACQFFTGDDAVAIKSGKNPEGNVINRAARRICVFDCVSAYGHGVTIGSEMSGGVEDVRIWDCDLEKAVYGIEIKGTKKRGGYVRNVHMRDCRVARVLMHAVGYNDDGIGAKTPPRFTDCTFENVTISGRYMNRNSEIVECPAVEIVGFEEPGYEVQNIAFLHCCISQEAAIKLSRCRNICCEWNDVQ